MNTFNYAGYEVDFSKLPEASTVALLRRGATHFLGNEQASKVAAWIKRQETQPTDEAIATQRAEYITAAVAALEAGTIGQRAPGTGRTAAKLDPIGTMVRKLAKATVMKLLSDAKLKAPKGEAKIKTGSGDFTMDELIERQIAKGGEALVSEAKKAVEADARRVAKVSEGSDGL